MHIYRRVHGILCTILPHGRHVKNGMELAIIINTLTASFGSSGQEAKHAPCIDIEHARVIQLHTTLTGRLGRMITLRPVQIGRCAHACSIDIAIACLYIPTTSTGMATGRLGEQLLTLKAIIAK